MSSYDEVLASLNENKWDSVEILTETRRVSVPIRVVQQLTVMEYDVSGLGNRWIGDRKIGTLEVFVIKASTEGYAPRYAIPKLETRSIEVSFYPHKGSLCKISSQEDSLHELLYTISAYGKASGAVEQLRMVTKHREVNAQYLAKETDALTAAQSSFQTSLLEAATALGVSQETLMQNISAISDLSRRFAAQHVAQSSLDSRKSKLAELDFLETDIKAKHDVV